MALFIDSAREDDRINSERVCDAALAASAPFVQVECLWLAPSSFSVLFRDIAHQALGITCDVVGGRLPRLKDCAECFGLLRPTAAYTLDKWTRKRCVGFRFFMYIPRLALAARATSPFRLIQRLYFWIAYHNAPTVFYNTIIGVKAYFPRRP